MAPDRTVLLAAWSSLERRLRLRSASLRVRLCVWYVFFTFLCMGCYGALLSQYLKRELRASREETMRRRDHRFLAYMAGEERLYPGHNLAAQIAHFQEATPENDITEILDRDGHRLYPSADPGLPLPRNGQDCSQPCFVFVQRNAHPTRVLIHRTTLDGQPVWLIMGGSVDEHYDILNAVRGGYFLLLPIVLLGSVAGGFELSRRALLPVGRMTEAARRLTMTGLDGELPVPTTGDELQALAEAWNDLLRRLQEEIHRSTQFTLDASHDLRTAMTVILANAELALRRPRTGLEYRETMNTIRQEAEYVLNMLEEMLLAARSGAPASNLAREWLHLDELVAEVCEASGAAATIKDLRFEVQRLQPVEILGDRALLRRMLSALIDNAVKYTPAHGLVSVSLAPGARGMEFSVEDTGIGIVAELQPRIFDRLFRADAARDRAETPGHGLGLAIAKWIADVHGFTLTVESGVGLGSRFAVLIEES